MRDWPEYGVRISDFDQRSGIAEAAFRRHYRDVYRYLLRRTRDHHDAEELTQQVFVDAVSSIDRFVPGDAPVLAWLYTVAQRRFVDETRRRARLRLVRHDAALQDGSADYGPETARAIGHAIAKLSPEQQDVVVMKLLKGASFGEIAMRVGVTEEACRMRFSRAMRSLKETLEQEGLP